MTFPLGGKENVYEPWQICDHDHSGCFTAFCAEGRTVDQRLERSANVFAEIMAAPDKGIPRDLFDQAECTIIIAGLKAGGFIVGAKYGKEFITCRKKGGVGWST